jgi:hypothetical protein
MSTHHYTVRKPVLTPEVLKSAKADIKQYSIDHEPTRWAHGHMLLARHHSVDITQTLAPTRAADIGIEHIEEALKVITEDSPQRFVALQSVLASTYPKRVAGNRTENLTKALAAAKTAFRVCEMPGGACELSIVAELHETIACIYADEDFVSNDSQAANQDLGIRHFLASLQCSSMYGGNEIWVTAQLRVGVIYFRRKNGKRRSNLKVAIKHLVEALKVYTKSKDRDNWARTHEYLALSYGALLRLASKEAVEEISALVEKWIVSTTNALQVFSPTHDPKAW